MPKGEGVVEGGALEVALAGLPLPPDIVRRVDAALTRPADGRTASGKGGVSANLPLVWAATGAVIGRVRASTWWPEESSRRLAGPLYANEDGTGQYSGGFVPAVTAAAAGRLVGEARARTMDFLGAQLALSSACATHWRIQVLTVGERVQLHHGGAVDGDPSDDSPGSLIVADALGREVPGKWDRRSADPMASLFGRGQQERMWPWRAWCSTGEDVRRAWTAPLTDILDGRVTAGAVELLSRVRLRSTVLVVRYRSALLIVWGAGWNGNSIGCGGALAVDGREPVFFDVRTQHARNKLPPWTSTLERWDAEHSDHGHGAIVVRTRELRPWHRDGIATERVHTLSLDDAGELLSVIRWPGACQPPEVGSPAFVPMPKPEAHG